MLEADLFGQAETLFRMESDSYKKFSEKLSTLLKQAFQENQERDLLVDYVRLFTNPPGAVVKPYLSSWTSILGDDIVQEYLGFLRENGIQAADDFEDLPEHAAMVFDVLLLINDDSELRSRYFKKFIEPWGIEFAEAVQQNAETAFYQCFGEFLKQWLIDEKSRSARVDTLK